MEKCENIIAKIGEILAQETEIKFQSETGELFDIHPGMEIGKGKIIEVTNRKSLYNLLFGKERISAKDYKEMLNVFESVKSFVLENTSYQQRKKLESIE
jgi:predicted ATPase